MYSNVFGISRVFEKKAVLKFRLNVSFAFNFFNFSANYCYTEHKSYHFVVK